MIKRIIAALFVVLTLTGCTAETNHEQNEAQNFISISDLKNRVISHDHFDAGLPIIKIALPECNANVVLSHSEPISDGVLEENEYSYQEDINISYNSFDRIYGDLNGLNSFDGTYGYGGHLETYYGEYAAYDNELWVDDEGFFRDNQGRYVVSSSDYNEYDEIQISKGTAVVRDDGTAPGVVDVHVVWGR